MAEQTVELAPGESKEVSFETVPHEARAYTVSVDGLSGTFTALTPEVVDGRFVIAHAYWEGLPSWIQILPSNEWPANTAIQTIWKVENTGNVAAEFRAEFMGQSGSISLNPGESNSIALTASTGDPGTYSYPVNLYADGTLVDSSTIGVVVPAPPPPPPELAGAFCAPHRWDVPPYERPQFWCLYEGLGGWKELIGDHWRLPSRTLVSIYIMAVNTGDIAADFKVGLQPEYYVETYPNIEFRSSQARLAPGERSDYFNVNFRTFGPGDGFYYNDQLIIPPGTNIWTFRLYADGQIVDIIEKTITTF